MVLYFWIQRRHFCRRTGTRYLVRNGGRVEVLCLASRRIRWAWMGRGGGDWGGKSVWEQQSCGWCRCRSGLVRVPIPVCQDAETQETERKQWGKTRGTNARPRPGWGIDEMEESSLRREQSSSSSRTERHTAGGMGWGGLVWSGHSFVEGGRQTTGGGCLVRTCRGGDQSARL